MDTSNNDQEEASLTMMDVLEEEEAREEDAEAVLGAGDDEHCTYEKGYMTRQAVYACLTCCPVDGAQGRAGVCLACSIHCHTTHTLVELYTKREFRCDCGNDKFLMTTCKLFSQKDGSNTRNEYGQNHDGLYCSCHRPYPDPEDPVEDEMIQCCCCEDWFHGRHLGVSAPPAADKYCEMVCPGCIDRLPFLASYRGLSVTMVSNSDSNVAVDVEGITGENGSQHCDAVKEATNTSAAATSTVAKGEEQSKGGEAEGEYDEKAKKICDETNCGSKDDEKLNEAMDLEKVDKTETSKGESKDDHQNEMKNVKDDEKEEKKETGGKKETEGSATECTLGRHRGTAAGASAADASAADVSAAHASAADVSAAMFLPEDWREHLCCCSACKALYKHHSVSFLLSSTDSIMEYELESRRRARHNRTNSRERSVEREMNALNSVDRVTRIEMVAEYNTLSTELREYLRKFAESGKVVRDEDIREFFTGLTQRKKHRGHDGLPPSSCKL